MKHKIENLVTFPIQRNVHINGI